MVHTAYREISEEELINTLRASANANQREGFIRVTFTAGDYTGGNDAPCKFDLLMAESVSDPTASGSE